MSITLDFDKGTVKAQLDEIAEALKDGSVEALDEAASEIVNYAQMGCPVSTGSLRSSIRKERVDHIKFRVRAGGYVINPRTGKLVNYASYVEVKQPFMRPAYELVRSHIVEKIKKQVMEKVRL